MRIPLIALATAAVVAAVAISSPAARGGVEAAVVRVDQVGYAPTETKHAYLMAQRSVLGARYSVINESGQTVLGGTTNRSRGSWNPRYSRISVLDISKVTTPGRYHIEVSGVVTGKSPVFRVAEPSDLFGQVAANNVRFFRSQRDGANVDTSLLRRKPSRLADRDAGVTS